MPGTSQLNSSTLSDLIMNQRYGVEYQPIIDQHGNVFGYEALARFFTQEGASVPPLQVFDALHGSPLSLYEVEYAMKRLQLDQAPAEGRLFVNLDPHAVIAFGCLDDCNPLLRLPLGQRHLCVEMIENTDVTDARLCLELADFFQSKGVTLALDDLGAPDSLLSFEVLMIVDFVKFDRSWPRKLAEPRYRKLVKALMDYIKKSGKRAIIEGIETKEDLAISRDFGFDLAQGFLFRDRFISSRGNSTVTSVSNQRITLERQFSDSANSANDCVLSRL